MGWWKRSRGIWRVHSLEGFTLLEVMVALAVLAIALTVLLGLRNRDFELRTHAHNVTVASLLAQEKLAEAEMGAFPSVGEQDGGFGNRYPNFMWQRSILATPFDSVREVRVRVTWERGSQKEGVNFVGYVFQEE
ncbi:MAG: type II secretion system minor pseudopilin GspI [Candidatus Binatia bacterium]